MNIKLLFQNWKTTSAGLAMIIGSAVHLIFAVKSGNADESTWTNSLLAIAGGIGLIAAGDGAQSAANHAETLAALDTIATAVKTGDTSVLQKPVAQPPTKP